MIRTDPAPRGGNISRRTLLVGILGAAAESLTGCAEPKRIEATPAPAGEPHTPEAVPNTTATSDKAPTQEVSSGEVLTNNDASKELSPELLAIYNTIASKVESGDITVDTYAALSRPEQVLVEQALLNRAVENGWAHFNLSVCSPRGRDRKGCDNRFNTPDDTNEEVYGKLLNILSAPTAYTIDSAKGTVSQLDGNAARILLRAPYDAPDNLTGGALVIYSHYAKQVQDGIIVNRPPQKVTVTDPTGGKGKASRVITGFEEASGQTARVSMELRTYELDGAQAVAALGVPKASKLNLAVWKVSGIQ